MLLISQGDNGRTLDIRPGQSVRITLAENAASGYRWAMDRCDQEFVAALGSEARYPEHGVGSGGEVAFTFQAKKIGAADVALKHWRHWEGDASVTARFAIRLRIHE